VKFAIVVQGNSVHLMKDAQASDADDEMSVSHGPLCSFLCCNMQVAKAHSEEKRTFVRSCQQRKCDVVCPRLVTALLLFQQTLAL
jgi:hypothetical protein